MVRFLVIRDPKKSASDALSFGSRITRKRSAEQQAGEQIFSHQAVTISGYRNSLASLLDEIFAFVENFS